MKLKPQLTWFPWLLYALMALQSVAAYTLFNPHVGNNDEPLLFGTVAVVLWIERHSIMASLRGDGLGRPWRGFAVFFFGLIIFVLGRLFPVMTLEVWGLFIMASGLVMALAPPDELRSALFIGFSGTVLVILGRIAPEALSSKLAISIASITAMLLNSTLIPSVAHGVVVYFGPYSAEVAHACSGMNSIFSLIALSVLYLREGTQRKLWHMAVLVALVIPVAVLTNTIRVIMLVLATWYIGEGFAQWVFHDVAGILVFVLALALLALSDLLLFRVGGKAYATTEMRGKE